ncbi:MAG: hypothetical protein ACLFVP_08005 [Candidatus Bathyarchaeia archaeon]
MNASIEYIAAGIIMCLILGVTSRYTTDMVYDRVNMIERNQGLEKAGKILDLMLLTEGKPSDWDESPEDPEILGLASANSIKMYQLDEEKVRRLLPNSPGYISPSRIRELMGLGIEYYIAIKIFPLFNVTVERVSLENFKTRFYNQWGTPVSNINVTVAYLNNRQAEDLSEAELDAFMDLDLEAIYNTSRTNSMGISNLELTGAEEVGCMLIYARQLTGKCLFLLNLNNTDVSFALSPHIIHIVDSSMGSVSGYNAEMVSRNVKMDGRDYIAKFTLWS